MLLASVPKNTVKFPSNHYKSSHSSTESFASNSNKDLTNDSNEHFVEKHSIESNQSEIKPMITQTDAIEYDDDNDFDNFVESVATVSETNTHSKPIIFDAFNDNNIQVLTPEIPLTQHTTSTTTTNAMVSSDLDFLEAFTTKTTIKSVNSTNNYQSNYQNDLLFDNNTFETTNTNHTINGILNSKSEELNDSTNDFVEIFLKNLPNIYYILE